MIIDNTRNQFTAFTVSDAETRKVIADFLEMGLADNIIAMFRQDETLYDWTGMLLNDERFMVRMGLVVVFEELVKTEGAEKRRGPSMPSCRCSEARPRPTCEARR